MTSRRSTSTYALRSGGCKAPANGAPGSLSTADTPLAWQRGQASREDSGPITLLCLLLGPLSPAPADAERRQATALRAYRSRTGRRYLRRVAVLGTRRLGAYLPGLDGSRIDGFSGSADLIVACRVAVAIMR